MTNHGRVRVFIATSLDGFIAGAEDDLSWLTPPGDEEYERSGIPYDEFIADIGAMLMGRRTYDVVRGFDTPWPYGDLPVLVATRRPLGESPDTVEAMSGDIAELVAAAQNRAGGKDVYLDGGVIIREALDAGLVDELIVTFAAVALGDGIPLFAGLSRRAHFDLVATHPYGSSMFQVVLKPQTDTDGSSPDD